MSDHMREQFEDMMSSQGKWSQAIEKDLKGGYKSATAATAWETWQSAWEAGQEMMKSRIKELEAEIEMAKRHLKDVLSERHAFEAALSEERKKSKELEADLANYLANFVSREAYEAEKVLRERLQTQTESQRVLEAQLQGEINELEAENAILQAHALTADHPLIKFLLGEGAFHGKWFGEREDRGDYGARFWWRDHLRAAVAESKKGAAL